MKRSEASVTLAIFAGFFFLISVLVPIGLYAFGSTNWDRVFALGGFMLLGIGMGACLYGMSVVLREAGHLPAAGAEPNELGIVMDKPARSYPTPREMLSSVKTLIELENWKLAHQRAVELTETFPKSEEALKLKKNLDYLSKKASA